MSNDQMRQSIHIAVEGVADRIRAMYFPSYRQIHSEDSDYATAYSIQLIKKLRGDSVVRQVARRIWLTSMGSDATDDGEIY